MHQYKTVHYFKCLMFSRVHCKKCWTAQSKYDASPSMMSLLIPQTLTWQNVIYQARLDDVSPAWKTSRDVSPLTVKSRSQPATLVMCPLNSVVIQRDVQLMHMPPWHKQIETFGWEFRKCVVTLLQNRFPAESVAERKYVYKFLRTDDESHAPWPAQKETRLVAQNKT